MASKGAFYPRVDTFLTYASYTWQDYFFDSLENSGDEVRFQTTVSMNLFDGMKKYARISQARLAEERLRHGIEELTASLEARLENIFLGLAVARDNHI